MPIIALMSNDEKSTKEKSLPLRIDFLLQSFVSLADDIGIGMGVILTVDGMVISGHIIKRDEYFNRMMAVMGNPENVKVKQGDKEVGGVIAKHFANTFQTFKDAPNKNKTETSAWPAFIHLEKVSILDISTNRFIPLKGALWRGKLDSVDGVIFGAAEQADANNSTQ
jgi:hypothetical protein